MGFSFQGVWIMGYCGLMGYGLQIPANQLGGSNFSMGYEGLWVFTGMGYEGFDCISVDHFPIVHKPTHAPNSTHLNVLRLFSYLKYLIQSKPS